ncbi:unnamed protein product, partial [Iphiclides podalirius]
MKSIIGMTRAAQCDVAGLKRRTPATERRLRRVPSRKRCAEGPWHVAAINHGARCQRPQALPMPGPVTSRRQLPTASTAYGQRGQPFGGRRGQRRLPAIVLHATDSDARLCVRPLAPTSTPYTRNLKDTYDRVCRSVLCVAIIHSVRQ